ncbi:MAG TPA: bacillithiol transferase BstA [Candidatus Kapabacteria bacterium]|nr:bacillithiol transferase BstA [Candidatus Kapabacteria bacterium]
MDEATLYKLRYPIGEFEPKDSYSIAERAANITTIRELPQKLVRAVETLNDSQLDTPYRDGGWTVRQVVHHLPDSHMNAFIRQRLALTENNPTIKPYDEAQWATFTDNTRAPVALSLSLISGLHERWALMLESLTEEQLHRTYEHPESGVWTLEQSIADYAWHCDHHLAHITELKKRMNW